MGRKKLKPGPVIELESVHACLMDPQTVEVTQEDDEGCTHSGGPHRNSVILYKDDLSIVRGVLETSRDAAWENNHAVAMGCGLVMIDQSDGTSSARGGAAKFDRIVVEEADLAELKRMVA